jgi:hypothetical protein
VVYLLCLEDGDTSLLTTYLDTLLRPELSSNFIRNIGNHLPDYTVWNFYFEVCVSMFLWNVGTHIPDYACGSLTLKMKATSSSEMFVTTYHASKSVRSALRMREICSFETVTHTSQTTWWDQSDYGGNNFLQNIRANLPDYVASNTEDTYNMNHEECPPAFAGNGRGGEINAWQYKLRVIICLSSLH